MVGITSGGIGEIGFGSDAERELNTSLGKRLILSY